MKNSYFSSNLLILRKKKSKTQNELSEDLGVKPSTVSGYENGYSTPDMATLLKIVEYFDVNLHDLMYTDFKKAEKTKDKKQYQELPVPLAVVSEPETYADNLVGKLRHIPILDQRAAAGWPYASEDTGYLSRLPVFTVPYTWFRGGEYALIETDGDSMHPTIYNGDWLFIKRITDLKDVKDGHAHVVLTRDGVVVKRLVNRVADGYLALQSDNRIYTTYRVDLRDVLQVWKVDRKLSAIIRNEQADLVNRMDQMEADLVFLKSKIK